MLDRFFNVSFARPQSWSISFDIKFGYHHIEIFEPDQQLHGFSWDFEDLTSISKFTTLPFGMSTGPYMFSKVLRPLVKY